MGLPAAHACTFQIEKFCLCLVTNVSCRTVRLSFGSVFRQPLVRLSFVSRPSLVRLLFGSRSVFVSRWSDEYRSERMTRDRSTQTNYKLVQIEGECGEELEGN